MLLNFGADTWLQLADYGLEVLLRPLDICVMNTSIMTHATFRAAYSDTSARWACSCYFQEAAINPKLDVATHSATQINQVAQEVRETWHRRSTKPKGRW